jgi:hypothetical protein
MRSSQTRHGGSSTKLPLLRKDLALLFCVLSFRQWHSAFLAFVDAKCGK